MLITKVRGVYLTFFLEAISFVPGMNLLNAQIDSIQQLKQVEVTAERIDLTDIGKHTDRIDSNTLEIRHHDNLAKMLAMHTPLFVRTYGAGTLATLGIRGGSASHTQLLWNGIPLRNPMIGLQDLALIPSAFIDEAAVHYGGHGAAFGSGAVGGLISIENSPVSIINRMHLNLTAGSWGHRAGDIQLDYGISKLRFSSRFFTQHVENNFRFRLAKGLPERNQVHHKLKNQGLLQEISYYINDKQRLTGRLWFQYADRQIPPTSTQTTSKSAQQDKTFRASLQWNHTGEKFHWQIKSAWLDEINDFQDSLILLYANNHFRTWLAEGETSFHFGHNVHFAGGIYTEVAKGESGNYLSGITRNQSAVFSSVRVIAKDWLWRLQAREEVTGSSWSPFLIDFSSEWSGVKNTTIKSSISRNYRVPTLNDLNWRPGGNPDLLPEEGWTMEAGIHYRVSNKTINLSTSLTGYSRIIDQWVMWMPPVKDLRNYWSPINITKVKSQGLETRGSLGWTSAPWKFDLDLGLDLTWSTFETPLTEFQIEAGEQLFYVPVENIMSGMTVRFQNLSGYYNHHWFGSSSGINDQINAANLGSAGISVHFEKFKWKESIYLQVENVWNVPYRIIERRPMPGRSFIGGVKFSI